MPGPISSADRGGPIVPALTHIRTPAERADQALAWARSDEAFFAAGACHILAFAALERWGDDEHHLVHLLGTDGTGFGSHVWLAGHGRAFDFNGWNDADELVEVNVEATRAIRPGWDHELRTITTSLEQFCADRRHRPPADYHADPRPRAAAFLSRFE